MNKQYRLEDALTNEHLVEFDAQQFVHDGLYCKTIYLKKGETISGKLVEKPAVIIINGNCRISIGGKSAHICGYKVFNVTDINAQQSIESFDYTSLTMIIKTAAKNTQEFEVESRTMPSAMPVSPSTIDYGMAEHGIQDVVPVALPSENIAVQNAIQAQPKEIINIDEQKNVEPLKEKTETSESIVQDQTEKSIEDEKEDEEEKFFDYSDEMCEIPTAEDFFEKYVLLDSENTDSAAEFSRKFELINKEIESKANSISEEINKKANRLPIDAEEAELEFAHYLENIATDLYNKHFNFSGVTAKKVINFITMTVLGGVSGFAIFTSSGRRLAKNYANRIATKFTDLFVSKKPRFIETEEIEKFEEEVRSLYSSDKSVDIIEKGFIPIRKMLKNYPINEDQFNRFRSKLLDVLDEAAKGDLGFPKKYKSMIDPSISHDE